MNPPTNPTKNPAVCALSGAAIAVVRSARWRSWGSRLAQLLLALALAAGVLYATSGMAWALPSLCPATPPAIDNPFESDAAAVDSGVHTVADSTRYGQRGYAGLSWSTYDLGCIPNVGAELDTEAGNAMLELAVDSTAVWQGLSGLATTADLSPASQAAGETASALFGGLFSPWVPVAATISALVMLFAAGRGETARVLSRAGLSIVALGVAGLALNGAGVSLAGDLRAGFSDAIASVQSGVATQLHADPVAGPRTLVVDQLLWRSWKNGEVGDAGPDQLAEALYENQSLTKDEATRIAADTGSAQQLFDSKNQAWQAAAKNAQQTNPAAYQSIQGRGSSRFGAGMRALLFVAPIAWFQILSLFLVLGLLLGCALLPVAAPLVGLAAVISPTALEKAVKAGGSVVLAGLVSAVAAIVQIALATRLLGAAPTSMFTAVILLAVTILARRLLKPFTSITGVLRTVVGQPARAALAVARYRTLARLVTGGATGTRRPAEPSSIWTDTRRARPDVPLLGHGDRASITRRKPGRGPRRNPPPTDPTGGPANPTPGPKGPNNNGGGAGAGGARAQPPAAARPHTTSSPAGSAASNSGPRFTVSAPASRWPRSRSAAGEDLPARAGWFVPPSAIYLPSGSRPPRAGAGSTRASQPASASQPRPDVTSKRAPR